MKKVYLSQQDRKIFGICGGIGRVYDIDPNLIRLGCIYLCLATAIIPFLVTYLIAWVIFPNEPQQ